MATTVGIEEMKKHDCNSHSVGQRIANVLAKVVATSVLGLISAQSFGQITMETPAVRLQSAPLVTPANAWLHYGSSTVNTPGAAAPTQSMVEIQNVARGLGANQRIAGTITVDDYASRVFEYVRNNIDTEFRFGLGKGARGAIIDQSGTPFDQAHLMFELLKQGNVNPNYKVGTITINAQQFGQWTGLVTNLVQATPPALPTFTVDAQSACQFLADGGIPAMVNGASSCSFASGTTVSTVLLSHIWIEANGKLYDPSFKRYNLRSGIDIAQRMGCGTLAAPTCGNSAATAIVAGATWGTLSGATTVSKLNDASLSSTLQNYAVNLQTYIDANLPDAPLEDVIGGRILDETFAPVPGATLTHSSATTDQYTWSSKIPDQFRTRVRMQWTNIDPVLYADELSGQRVEYLSLYNPGNPQFGIVVDGVAVAMSNMSPVHLLIGFDHPYAANAGAFGDETREYDAGISNAYSTAIMISLGNAGAGLPKHYSDRQHGSQQANYMDVQMEFPDFQPGAAAGTLSSSQLLYQQSLTARLIEGVTATRVTSHHTVAMGSANKLHMQALLSVNSPNVDAPQRATTRNAAFESFAAMGAMVEGSILQQQQDAWIPYSTPGLFYLSNLRQVPFVDVTSLAHLQPLVGQYDTSLLGTRINDGYRFILPQTTIDNSGVALTGGAFMTYGHGELAYKADAVGYLLNGLTKGAATPPSFGDPVKAALDAAKPPKSGLRNRGAVSVSLVGGDVSLTAAPDLVTGSGGFPYALPFQRTYHSGNTYTELEHAPWSFGGYAFAGGYSDYKRGYYGADANSMTRLGGGWTHNYQVTATISNDGTTGLGVNRGADAVAAIVGFYTVADLSKALDFTRRLTSTFTANWTSRQFMSNVATVERLPSTIKFVRGANGTFRPPTGSNDRLIQTGSKSGPLCVGCSQPPPAFLARDPATIYDYAGITLTYTDSQGGVISFTPSEQTTSLIGSGGQFTSRPVFVADSWVFPEGVRINFTYSTYPSAPNASIRLRKLDSVSNNLGRSLTFTSTDTNGIASTSLRIREVRDESDVAVSFEPNCTGSTADMNNVTGKWWWGAYGCRTFEVVTPDGKRTKYNYEVSATSPEEGHSTRPWYRLRDWFTPDDLSTPFMTIDYDSDYRAKRLVYKDGTYTSYFMTGLTGTEIQRRGETMDYIGAVSTQYFNRYGKVVSTIDPLGRTTWLTYDDRQRLHSTIAPEGNSTEYSYDARGNVLTETNRPKPNSSWAAVTTVNTYMEPATTVTCSNYATCNKLASSTDAKGRISNYDYNSLGQLKQIKGPTTGGVRGETDVCYSILGGISFPTGKIDVVGNGKPNRVTTFAYNAANKYVLDSAQVDPSDSLMTDCSPITKAGALNLKTTFTFDGKGNIRTVDGPRTDVNDIKTYRFDAMRRIEEVDVQSGSDPLYGVTLFQYYDDGALRTTSQKETVGGVANWRTETRTYWPTGELKTVSDPEGNVTTNYYDAVGRLNLVVDPEGQRTATVYDLAGQTRCLWKGWDSAAAPTVWKQTSQSSCAWNPADYVAAGYTGKYRYVAYDYSSNGKQTQIKDATNNITDLIYDNFDRLRFKLFPAPTGATAGQRCTPASVETVTTLTCPTGATYEELRYSTSGAPATTASELCSSDNQVCAKRTRAAQLISFTYDEMNRIASKTATGLPAITYTYNLLNEPASLTSPSQGAAGSMPAIPAHAIGYDYDDAGRKAFEENALLGGTKRVTYAYDEGSNRKRTTWPDSYNVTYQYDALNRMQYVRENSVSANELAYYDYDTLSRRKTLCFGGQSASCSSGAGTNKTTYTYEPDSSLDVLTQVLNTVNVSLDYDHRRNGQIESTLASDDFYLATPAGGNNQVKLSWAPASDNVGVTTYSVERCTGAGCTTGFSVLNAAVTGTTYIDTSAASNNYVYRVKAVDAANNSTYSTNIAVGIPGSDSQPPGSISGLTRTVISSSQINLTWTAATDNVAVTNYAIERCQGSSCSNFVQLATVSGTSYNNSGLVASTSYSYRVYALDAANNAGSYSATVSGTTQAGGGATIAYKQGNWTVSSSPISTITVKYTGAQTAGNLNVVIVGWNNATSTVQSVVDSKGNPYVKAVGPTISAGHATQSIYYAKNIVAATAGSNTVTVTLNSAAIYPDVRIAEYSGIDTVNPVDVFVGASGSGTSMNSGSITTTNANDLLVAGNMVEHTTNAAGAGFTSRMQTSAQDILEDRIVTSTNSYSAGATQDACCWWVMQMVAFKAASAGGGGGTDTQAPSAPGNVLAAFSSGDTYVPNALNQYASVNGNTFTYDTNGNLTSWVAQDGRHTYFYDSENRLRTAAVGGSSTATIIYDYDPLGRRISKTVGSTVTQYLLDGDEEIAELDSAGAVLRRYITGNAIDDRIARAEGSATSNPTKYYYHVNHQGSVIDMTDAAGTITQKLAYDEYGNLTSAPPATGTGESFRYTGRRYDNETGLYYYRARYYSPQLGRFLQTDPIGYEDDVNLYAYVGNDPGNYIDQSGEQGVPVSLFVRPPTVLEPMIRTGVETAGGGRTTVQQAVRGALQEAAEASKPREVTKPNTNQNPLEQRPGESIQKYADRMSKPAEGLKEGTKQPTDKVSNIPPREMSTRETLWKVLSEVVKALTGGGDTHHSAAPGVPNESNKSSTADKSPTTNTNSEQTQPIRESRCPSDIWCA